MNIDELRYYFIFFIVKVLELDSRNVKALYRRAQAYIQLVDLDLAEMDIKKALEIEPENRYALSLSYNLQHGAAVVSLIFFFSFGTLFSCINT